MNRCNASIRARLCLIGDAGVFRAWHYSESRPPYPKMIDLSTPGLAYLTLLSPAMRRSGTRTEVCYRAYLPSSIWAASVNVLGSYRCAGHSAVLPAVAMSVCPKSKAASTPTWAPVPNGQSLAFVAWCSARLC